LTQSFTAVGEEAKGTNLDCSRYKLTLVLCSPNEKRMPWLRKGTEEINKTSEINKQGQKRMSYIVKTGAGDQNNCDVTKSTTLPST